MYLTSDKHLNRNGKVWTNQAPDGGGRLTKTSRFFPQHAMCWLGENDLVQGRQWEIRVMRITIALPIGKRDRGEEILTGNQIMHSTHTDHKKHGPRTNFHF